MPYTEEEGGRLNNFAREPKMYKAEPPTPGEQRKYIFLGIGGFALVAAVVAVAVAASAT